MEWSWCGENINNVNVDLNVDDADDDDDDDDANVNTLHWAVRCTINSRSLVYVICVCMETWTGPQ